MARRNDPQHMVKVATVPPRDHVQVGKPGKVVIGSMRAKFASGGFGGASIGGTMMGAGGNFYSPELSTDFLELPQSLDETWHYYRHFAKYDPFVKQALTLLTDLPLSKVTFRKPKSKNKKMAEASMRMTKKWARRIGLFQRLREIVWDLNLIGEASVFSEDPSPDMPQEVTHEFVREVTPEGEPVEKWLERPDAKKRAIRWLRKNFKGWSAMRVLPPEQVKIESFSFTDKKLVDLIPDTKTRDLIERARMGDLRAMEIVESMPRDVVEHIARGEGIPLNTNAYAGSFVHTLAHTKSQYEERGQSVIQSCLRVLIYRDKLRQAQTSIASRHMTPYRLIYAEDMNSQQVEELREQVDLALQDPDFSIITNFPVTWEEMGGGNSNRLIDLSSEYDLTDRQLYAGLGMTESLLSGESSYSGDRIHLEVINIRFAHLRDALCEYIDQMIIEPMCARMGFVEIDEDGDEIIVAPRLSFTRLGLRDNQELFDILFNLYQKGSLDIDTIFDLLNIDSDLVKERLEADMFTVKDAMFNEVIRSVASRVGDSIAENSNVSQKITEYLQLNWEPPKEEGMSRFAASKQTSEDPKVDAAMKMIVGGTLEAAQRMFEDPEFQQLLVRDSDPNVPLADEETLAALNQRVDAAAQVVHHELRTRTTAWRRAMVEQNAA